MSTSTVTIDMLNHAVLFFVCAVADVNHLVCSHKTDAAIRKAIVRADISNFCVRNIIVAANRSGVDQDHLLAADAHIEAARSTLRYRRQAVT